MERKSRKLWFAAGVMLAAIVIFVYNMLTPYFTDDLIYGYQVKQAGSLLELLQQEINQYQTWSGRSVSHFILRLFLTQEKWLFNLCNSMVFIGLNLLIYANIEKKKTYSLKLFLLIQVLIWTFGVEFAQTVLWETGACNYLWGTTIILGFLTLFRCSVRNAETVKHKTILSVFLFFFGILAGWCNENTSGGAILGALLFTGSYIYQNRSAKPWMVSGLTGLFVGFGMMILAPGNQVRSQYMEESHSGLAAIAARTLKCTLAIENLFLELLILLLAAVLILWGQKKIRNIFRKEKMERSILMAAFWTFLFLAVSYALILAPEPMPRAYFGAGIFLIMAVVQALEAIEGQDSFSKVFTPAVTGILTLCFFFTCVESGADLARIYREDRERVAYIEQQKAEGNLELTVPMLRPEFENKYSDGHNSDLTEDPENWVNVAYMDYYGLESITAVPRDEWSEY